MADEKPSVAEELHKLAELRDKKVITHDEFAQIKASLLATVVSPTGVAVADERAARLREQLEQFKGQFAGSSDRQMRALLEQAEDLLIAVCGQERFRGYVRDAMGILGLMEDLQETRGADAYRERVKLRQQISEETASLKRRIASIEYR